LLAVVFLHPSERMAETLIRFQTPIASPDGILYEARACGSASDDGMWQGWIEFMPIDGGKPVRSSRETTQPNRQDTEYWATGLSPVYLEGALERALDRPRSVPPLRVEPPLFQQPASALPRATVGSRESVLDPFSVYAKGEQVLRRQLGALSDWHLINIALARDLTDEPIEALNRRSSAYLIELIVKSVRERQKVFEQ
jgi:hypothetical protein